MLTRVRRSDLVVAAVVVVAMGAGLGLTVAAMLGVTGPVAQAKQGAPGRPTVPPNRHEGGPSVARTYDFVG